MKDTPTPSCPRCGYDQSGVVASWTEACPLRGTCSECGINFDWVLVFRPQFIPVPDHRVSGPAAFFVFMALGAALILLIGWIAMTYG